MTLLEEIAQEAQSRPKGPPCTVRVLLESLPADEAADMVAAINGPYMATAVAAVLKRHGHTLSDATISRHRRGSCSCPR